MRDIFSPWAKWAKRNELPELLLPGIYVITISDKDISSMPFSWHCEIVYIGMTNSIGGLKSRLQQFDNTIKGKSGHGGAHRVRFKYPDYSNLSTKLYVSVCPNECNVRSNNPADLRIMGDVAKQEYECFAIFAERFKKLPEFNDKSISKKK